TLQFFQSLVERDQIYLALLRKANSLIERKFLSPTAALLGSSRQRVVHENPPHHLRSDAKEMRSILPGYGQEPGITAYYPASWQHNHRTSRQLYLPTDKRWFPDRRRRVDSICNRNLEP